MAKKMKPGKISKEMKVQLGEAISSDKARIINYGLKNVFFDQDSQILSSVMKIQTDLRIILRKKKINRTEFARLIGCSKKEIYELLNSKLFNLDLRTMAHIACVLDGHLNIRILSRGETIKVI
jgi:DNA-binding Xre family transcriptional regulator